MNVIFLDFDGVIINTPGSKQRQPFTEFDPYHCQLLNQITSATEAKLVLTSSWRYADAVEQDLIKSGVIGEVIDKTPDLLNPDKQHYLETRAEEIKLWLSNHLVENFIILDDANPKFFNGLSNLVCVFPSGLEKDHVDICIALLKGNYV